MVSNSAQAHPTKSSFRLEYLLFLLSGLAIAYANYLVFLVVPNERVMGPIQRIFYFHVGSAIACYCCIALVLAASLYYLATRSKTADLIAEACGEVGFVFCSMVLISGMIWGHSAWNTWFRFEPRLVTFLLLWLIFLGFNLLRLFADPARVGQHSAVLGIVGAITVPIMVFSIKLLPQVAQLHPQVVENRGLKDPSFQQAMFVSMAALVLLSASLVWLRVKLGFLKQRLGQISEGGSRS